MDKVPCFKCELRREGCHDTCEPYKRWSARRRAQNEKRMEEQRKYYTSSSKSGFK